MPNAVNKNGTARPAEYTARSKTPRATVSLAAANASTVARIGPMHGVQPKANAKPSKKPLNMPGFLLVLLRKCTSRFRKRVKAGPKKPIKEREKKWLRPTTQTSGQRRGD